MNMNELATLPQDPVELIKQAQHILEVTKDAVEHLDGIIYSARDCALDLLGALDESQKDYQPRPKEWVVQQLYDLVVLLDELNGGTQ